MNTVWSEKVQGIKTLYLTRQLRFDDLFFPQYEKLFDLDKNAPLKILEIGCGPGALAQALHRWYPNAQITAVDRDSNFISFAKENCPGIEFLEGDATALPFAADTFDVTISNTVQEHIEPTAFWGEQLRVLKKGGVCLCLSTRKKQFAERIIEANRQVAIEAVECASSVDKAKRNVALSAINKKYDERLSLFRAGKKQWDTSVTITMVVRGIKKE